MNTKHLWKKNSACKFITSFKNVKYMKIFCYIRKCEFLFEWYSWWKIVDYKFVFRGFSSCEHDTNIVDVPRVQKWGEGVLLRSNRGLSRNELQLCRTRKNCNKKIFFHCSSFRLHIFRIVSNVDQGAWKMKLKRIVSKFYQTNTFIKKLIKFQKTILVVDYGWRGVEEGWFFFQG